MTTPFLAEQRARPPEQNRVEPGPGPWLGVVAMGFLGLVLLVALAVLALDTQEGLDLDQRLMESLGHSATAAMRIQDWLTYVSFAGVALALAVCVVVALFRRRYVLAGAAVVLVAGANLTTRILKKVVLDRPDTLPNSLPSGHTTVAVALGLAAVIVAPAAWRWVVVPLAGFAGTFVGAGTVVGQWHRPADVLAAVAVCLVWTAVALGIALAAQREAPPVRTGWAARSSLALVGSALVGLCFVGWGLRPQDHDTQLALAVVALAPVGLVVGIALFWTSSIADRHLR